MNAEEFEELKAKCKPAQLWRAASGENCLGNVFVATSADHTILWAAEFDAAGRFMTFMPDHYIVDHVRKLKPEPKIFKEIERPDLDFAKYDYILGPL